MILYSIRPGAKRVAGFLHLRENTLQRQKEITEPKLKIVITGLLAFYIDCVYFFNIAYFPHVAGLYESYINVILSMIILSKTIALLPCD